MTRYKEFMNKEHAISFVYGVLLFCASLFLESLADTYVGGTKGIAVPDLLLGYLPAVNLTFVIVQGALALTALIVFLLFLKPKYINFTLKSLSVFILTRSFFISLTHLGADPNQAVFNINAFGFKAYDLLFNSSNDFFFSGHTGLPYLMALIFWKERFWRNAFIAISILFGVSVLLSHVHYSIDVFAAPFIIYSIFNISKYLFEKDYRHI